MNKPEEESTGKKSAKRLYIKIPKDFYTSSEAEQSAFIRELCELFMAQDENHHDVEKEEDK